MICFKSLGILASKTVELLRIEAMMSLVVSPEKGVLPEADLKFYGREYERLVVELENAMEKSSLPEKPTAKDDLNDLLIRLRLKELQ